MNRIHYTAAIALALMLSGTACKSDTTGLGLVTVPELASLIKESSAVTVVDANGGSTRDEYGVIPGAVLLTSGSGYDVAGELPADKAGSLVFYCSSEMCSAAPRAARRAVEAGYGNVSVLPAGIKGWVKAGHHVDKPPLG